MIGMSNEHLLAVCVSMANPRSQGGFTMIANELIEKALYKINLSGSEYRILWVIWRKTYGWHKEADAIALSQFEELTGMDRRNLVRTIKSLEAKNLIVKDTNGYINKYRFNSGYDTWNVKGVEDKKDTSVKRGMQAVSKLTPKLVSKLTPTKERRKYTKENIVTKESLASFLHTLNDDVPTKAREMLLHFLDKVRQGNKTRQIAPSRVEKIIQGLMSISQQYGEANLLLAIQKTITREDYNWSTRNSTGYVKTIAINLFNNSIQDGVGEKSRAEKEVLAKVEGSEIFKDIIQEFK